MQPGLDFRCRYTTQSLDLAVSYPGNSFMSHRIVLVLDETCTLSCVTSLQARSCLVSPPEKSLDLDDSHASLEETFLLQFANKLDQHHHYDVTNVFPLGLHIH